VLYALSPSNGRVWWAARVGLDTTVLPVRIPAHQAAEELILVTSSDTRTLSALKAARGEAVWHRRISAPCLGHPTVAGQRIYVPCYDGRVHEVDAATGALVGSFDMGQRLSRGGVIDEDTGLYYIAADSDCVYVLDFAQRRCAGILYSEHPRGSLRCEPAILHWKDVAPDAEPSPDSPRSCLMLCQAAGLETTELRPFILPITRNDVGRLRPFRFPGWTWFPPMGDGEKLAVVTDDGHMGVFGIRQKNNRDPLLYPMLDKPLVLEKSEGAPAQRRGRAQVVAFDESDFWVLAHGELHRLRLAFGPGGWQMTEVWKNPLFLGSALHAGQADLGHGAVYLVTHPGQERVCVASAVRAEADAGDPDKIRWQTLLGLVCQGEPVALPGAVLVQDARGSLFRFDAAKYKDRDVAWHIHEKQEAKPPANEHVRGVRLLPAPDGAFALAATGAPGSGGLLVRHFTSAKNQTLQYDFKLPAAVTGTPGAWVDHLVFPVGDGVLWRKEDAAAGSPVAGLNWRAERADAAAEGHVIPLTASDFLVTDGSRSLLRMSWPKGGDCMRKNSLTLPARIVSAPLLRLGGDGNFVVFVADADNRITKLQGSLNSDRLEEVSEPLLQGKITMGPFDLGAVIGCVVDGDRLVVMDPKKLQQLWTYPPAAEIVGKPIAFGGVIIVADAQGRFIGLDPGTGKRRGPGYRLRANVAPATGPVALGADRLFVPLMDGTVLLLSLQHFQGPLPAKRPSPERYL
jgi:hypothetical protein